MTTTPYPMPVIPGKIIKQSAPQDHPQLARPFMKDFCKTLDAKPKFIRHQELHNFVIRMPIDRKERQKLLKTIAENQKSE